MDQMACAVGGTILLDFSKDVSYQKLDFDFEDFGYDLVIVNTGKGHANLSHEYSEVPTEMEAVATALGVSRLIESNLPEFTVELPQLLKQTENDRAILRALHFFMENDRVNQAAEAIRTGNREILKRVITESGRSSWELLQNCYSISDFKEQKITLDLTLTELFLKRKGDGCCRVHGGGFAGVIMSVVAKRDTEEYIQYISDFVGRDNVYPMRIRKYGAVHLEK